MYRMIFTLRNEVADMPKVLLNGNDDTSRANAMATNFDILEI